mmetsp:Transcript_20150/g.69431  ORF Transcript_20150/g.69431 Transcript_20150/m.69431 type:complete len:115 (+) Transcript_20150:128-472(+)
MSEMISNDDRNADKDFIDPAVVKRRRTADADASALARRVCRGAARPAVYTGEGPAAQHDVSLTKLKKVEYVLRAPRGPARAATPPRRGGGGPAEAGQRAWSMNIVVGSKRKSYF